MDRNTRKNLDNLLFKDGDVRYKALIDVLEATEKPVDWAYEVWGELIANLRHKDNHQRTIAAQVLANLAKSDPENRMLKDFDSLLAVTRDERFVTARHSLQAIWKVGTAGKKQQKLVVDRLSSRFRDCVAEKNCTLIRYDIIQGLRNLYDAVQDERVRARAMELIESEMDGKYRKKYSTVWRDSPV